MWHDRMVTGGMGQMNNIFGNIELEKQKRIIDAGIAEFAENGFRDMSTNKLVKKIGISKGSLFKYFGSKIDFYSYLIDITDEHLLNYMNEFKSLKADNLKDNIIFYVEKEYDYLIAHPKIYRFFCQLQRDLNLPELIDIKKKLKKRTIGINKKVLTDFGIVDDEDLKNHIILIIVSYNRMFIESMDMDSDWVSLKGPFMSGLENHLSFIKWRSQ